MEAIDWKAKVSCPCGGRFQRRGRGTHLRQVGHQKWAGSNPEEHEALKATWYEDLELLKKEDPWIDWRAFRCKTEQDRARNWAGYTPTLQPRVLK